MGSTKNKTDLILKFYKYIANLGSTRFKRITSLHTAITQWGDYVYILLEKLNMFWS